MLLTADSKLLYDNFIYHILPFKLIVNVAIIFVVLLLLFYEALKATDKHSVRFFTNGSLCHRSSQSEGSQSDLE